MKKINLIIVGLLSTLVLQAQSYEDALRYSESFIEGDARYMATSGALTSIGGSLSTISSNPAGSALFKKNVIELTPSYIYTKSENHYLGYDRAFESSLKIPSFGILGYKPMKQNDVFVSGITFSFALNANNRYQETLNYTGTNNSSSLTDDFLRLSNKESWDNSYNTLAWNSYLMDFDTVNQTYFTDFVDANGVSSYGEYQDIEINRDGVKREYLFNLGVDFSEYVFFGADLTFTNLYYNETKMITEKDLAQTKEYLSSYTYSTDLDVTGNGVGGKFGLIIKPIDYVRLGVAIHTPIIYNISEDYETQISADFDKDITGTNVYYSKDRYTSSFDYEIIQPMKIVASLGFVYKNVFNVGVDYESMDYSQISMRSDIESMSLQEQGIAENLTKVNNIKCGAEFRYGPFTFRAGYANYGNPYKNISGDNTYRTHYSAGVGLATNTFYYDLAWLRAKSEQTEILYSTSDVSNVSGKSTIKTDYLMFTAGFKF